jgi:hypothetical protein
VATAESFGDRYGVLVMLDPSGGYLLYVDVSPLEHVYAEGWCR